MGCLCNFCTTEMFCACVLHNWLSYYSAVVGEWSIAVSLSVCLSVCPRAYLWNCQSQNFVTMALWPMAQSSSRDIAIRYVLPVLWMTSRLAVVGSMALCSQPGLLILAVSYVRGQCTVWCLSMPCLFHLCNQTTTCSCVIVINSCSRRTLLCIIFKQRC